MNCVMEMIREEGFKKKGGKITIFCNGLVLS